MYTVLMLVYSHAMHTLIYAWSFGAAAGMVVRGACDACGGGQVTCVVREETDRRHHPPSMSTDVTNVTGAMYQCALHNLNIYIEEERDKTQTWHKCDQQHNMAAPNSQEI